MGSMFRSEEMALCQLFIPPEVAYTSISRLGESGKVQFRDLNAELSAIQRNFVGEVRRCDEMERKLRYIKKELIKDEISVAELFEEIPTAPANQRIINHLENELEKSQSEILELSQNSISLKADFLELTEMKEMLESTHVFFAEQEYPLNSVDDGTVQNDHNRLDFVAGVIDRDRIAGFERMLWRVSMGNVFLRQSDLGEKLKDPSSGHRLYKSVFIAFYQGDELKSRIKKVCVGYRASLYQCPAVYEERDAMYKGVRTRIEDLQIVLNQTQDHRQRVLVEVAKKIPEWAVMIRKMKAIYHTLNLFNMDVSRKCLICECWIPVNDIPSVRRDLMDGSEEVDSTIQSFINLIQYDEAPPTFFRTNKFTLGFQNLIEAYGTASYREVNPALYTIITFPFLFGVMFGDIGHGTIMLLAGLWMVLWERSLEAKRIKSEMWQIFFGGRYIILLMGLFSIYTGFIYNDIFSKSINLFGSAWQPRHNASTLSDSTIPSLVLNPEEEYAHDSVYLMGLDPAWQMAENKIIFHNSYKMKLSIIFGVLHMIFGVCMSLVNMIHFRRYASIVLEFVPQIVFLLLIFGYMVFMMVFKWFMYGGLKNASHKPGCAPSVLIMFIDMMLMQSTDPSDDCEAYMFSGQRVMQMFLVGLAVVCIPWMLLGKPLYILAGRKKQTRRERAGLERIQADHGEHDNEEMSEVFIQQAIHTIEYVLNTISHTASYLRLWALSLAHAQLADIVWQQILRRGFSMALGYFSVPLVVILFMVWSVLTVGILVIIEGLSAFLHTLRLHWVEFMSKFYSGMGYAFTPFSFQDVLKTEEQ